MNTKNYIHIAWLGRWCHSSKHGLGKILRMIKLAYSSFSDVRQSMSYNEHEFHNIHTIYYLMLDPLGYGVHLLVSLPSRL